MAAEGEVVVDTGVVGMSSSLMAVVVGVVDMGDTEEVRDTEEDIPPRKNRTRTTVRCMELEELRWGWRLVVG